MREECNVPNTTAEQRKWVWDQLAKVKGDLIFLGYHGSHLYGLDHAGSDIDLKAVYVPTMEEILMGNAINTYNWKNGRT